MLSITSSVLLSHCLYDNGANRQLGIDLFSDLISQCFAGNDIK